VKNKYVANSIAVGSLVGLLAFLFLVFSVALSGEKEKVVICHKPGTPAENTLAVAPEAVPGHLGHGDYEGSCNKQEPTTVPTATPYTPVPTAPVTRFPTATNTALPTSPPISKTEIPESTSTPVIPTATPIKESVIVITPTAVFSPTTDWIFNPTATATYEICDLCTAQEAALYAEARWYNSLSDFLDALKEGLVPEFVRVIFNDKN